MWHDFLERVTTRAAIFWMRWSRLSCSWGRPYNNEFAISKREVTKACTTCSEAVRFRYFRNRPILRRWRAEFRITFEKSVIQWHSWMQTFFSSWRSTIEDWKMKKHQVPSWGCLTLALTFADASQTWNYKGDWVRTISFQKFCFIHNIEFHGYSPLSSWYRFQHPFQMVDKTS